MARRRSSRRRRPARRRASTVARRTVRRVRRRTRRAASAIGTKVLSKGTLMTVAGTTGGFVAANVLVDQIPIDQLKTGNGRMAGKAIIAVAGGMVLRKFARNLAAPFTIGGLTAVALDLWNTYGPQQYRMGGVAGYTGYPDGIQLYGYQPAGLMTGGMGADGIDILDAEYARNN